MNYPSEPATVLRWARFEQTFRSESPYENPLREVTLRVTFTTPSGATHTVLGFWDGGHDWQVRFMPTDTGEWQYHTQCSDTTNAGLHRQSGSFTCVPNPSPLAIYRHGAVTHKAGQTYLSHADHTPFFYAACTAWNGALKSTEAEWDFYLKHRAEHHYTAVQFVTTQWRGGDVNSQLQTAYTGHRRIELNPAFFQHLDHKIDQINAHGLLAAPVLLWALPFRRGRHLSPGAALPRDQAVLLAQYLVARYGAHHVLWLLGGDGLYTKPYESRWKKIGQAVFGDRPPGNVALHPMGRSWIGEAYADEPWLNVVGYQSGHGTDQKSVEFITRGPATQSEPPLPPRPTINIEPCYEALRPEIDGTAVRNASYWSVFATPPAGIAYGANGIWPWIRPGERILNHGALGRQPTPSWRQSVDLPGSVQVGYLASFMQQFEWWTLRPDSDLLEEQPGDHDYRNFVSVLRTDDYHTILVYFPHKVSVRLQNPQQLSYRLRWFDPSENAFASGDSKTDSDLSLTSPLAQDAVAVLTH